MAVLSVYMIGDMELRVCRWIPLVHPVPLASSSLRGPPL